MRKRILSALLAVMFLFTGLPGTAWAVGEGNMEAGGGQTETVTGDSFWNGDWGIRFCVVDVASQTVVSATYDASNRNSGFEDYHHYGKTNKFDYRNGASLVIQKGLYSWNTPPVTIPTIVRTSGTPDIKAIKDYFTDETVIRWIGDVTGMAYDTLISGDYKLFIEPILYYTFDSQKYAMTATEAALFDRAINGLLLRTMGNATHQQLPLSLYLEKSDLGFSKWSGAKTGIQNDTNIINYLGMGIVSFIPEEEPEPGTGGDGDGPTVPISFRKTDPERFNAANYNTGLITFAPASSNSAAFDNISGAVIEISGNGTGAGTYELPCTVELGEGTFTVREVTPPYGYLINDAWSAEITVEVEKDGEGKPVEGAEAEATITVSGGGGTDGTSYASVDDYRQRGQLTVTKVDNETISLNHGNYRTPQGDATFAGAVFELRAAKDIYLPSTWIKIYSEGDLVATAVTGNDGSFTINGIEQGVYTLQEITPSDGYVFQGAKARGQIYTITNAYTGSGTNILSFDDKAAGDTGNKNQYANTVIKADLTLTKFNENRTVENEMDGNAYEMNKQPAEGVYFAVYLNSKAAAGGNPIYSTTDDPVGDGTSGSASTAGWGYLDLVNHNFYSPLPDEWFKQRDLDANNPLPNGNPSVEEGRAEETDLARISMKDLYMVLRTDSTGRATTLDPSTVVYCSWGELGNSAANGTAGIDYRLPYGLYTVIELNPYEGREPDMFEVFIGRDPEAEPATAPTETKSRSGEDYPYTSGWYDFNYNYILENKTLKQTVTVRKTDAQSGKTIPAANTTYRIWSWDNISANGATEHPLRPYEETYINLPVDERAIRDAILPPQDEEGMTEFEKAWRKNQAGFADRFAMQMTRTEIYLTLSYRVRAKLDNALAILLAAGERIQAYLSELGVTMEPVSVKQSLWLLHAIYNPYEEDTFILPPDIYRKGTKIRDYIAPSAFHFKPNHTELGGYFNRVLFVNGYSNSLDDEFISSLMDNRFKVTVAKHVDHVDKEIAFQQINARMRALESDRQTRNQRNARNGTNYIPFFLQSQIDACRGMMKDLQEAEELFRVGLYISISAHSMEELEDITKVIIGACRQHLVSVKRATMRQEDGLASILPLGQDRLQLAPYMMTSGLSMLLPFTYASVSQPHGLYYGKNTLSGAPLILDRKEAKNGNSFIIAKPGAGKSMHAKIEINNVLFSTHLDQIIAIDPEREFVELCRAHGGTVIRLAPGTESHINPLDAGRDNGRNEDFLLTKADMLQSLLAVFKGSRLTAAEKSLVDRTLREVYKPYVSGGYRSEDMPTLREFYNIIKENDQPEAKDLALTLEMYVFGTVDLFAHPTNVDMRNRFIVFDVRDLGANLKKAGMLIALDYIQNQLIANKEAGINTWLYADEFHLFYSDNEDENSAGIFFERVFARCRKYGGLATGITQNVTNVMASQSALSMLQNCQFVVLLDQAGENLRQLISLYDLSDQQAAQITKAKKGEGLLIYNDLPIPFSNIYPRDNIVYDALTTDFRDNQAQLQKRRESANLTAVERFKDDNQ